MTTRNVQILFRREPRGLPTADDFEIVETAVPVPEPGQFLIENQTLSLDPYMRMLMGGGWTFLGSGMRPGQVMVGRVLGKVAEAATPTSNPAISSSGAWAGRPMRCPTEPAWTSRSSPRTAFP